MQAVGLRPRLKARPSLVELLVRAGGQSDAALSAATASSPPLFSSASTAPASDRELGAVPGAGAVLHLHQQAAAANLPLPPSPDTPPLSVSAPPSPTSAPDNNNTNTPTIVIDLASAPAPAPSKPAPAPAAITSSPSMAPVSLLPPHSCCLPAHTTRIPPASSVSDGTPGPCNPLAVAFGH